MLSHRKITEDEVLIEYTRSSGPGGQNVNKVATKAQLRWRVGASRVFTEEQKERIRKKLATLLNKNDEIVLQGDTTRSQAQNRDLVLQKLNERVAGALFVPKKRRPTKPTRSSREKRLESKKKASVIKKSRKNIFF